MKKSTNKKGFTLVELIVVIAIIGVLAAILVPSMMGYVKSSKISAANSSAKSVYNAAANVCQKCETAGVPIEEGVYGQNYNGSDYTGDITSAVSSTDGQTFVAFIVKELGSTGGNAAFDVAVTDGGPVGAIYASTASDKKYTGGYPTAAKDVSNKKGGITEVAVGTNGSADFTVTA